MTEFISPNPHLHDLYLIQFGMEACKPGHSFGPSIREYYKIHYILDGEGVFQYEGKRYNLKKGDGFLLCPEKVAFYKADHERPWHYCWIGFNGTSAENLLLEAGLSNEVPIFHMNNGSLTQYVETMLRTNTNAQGRSIYLNGLLYMYFGELAQRSTKVKNVVSHNPKEKYINQVIDFIKLNYDSRITVEGIARSIGLQRNYLGTVFKEYTGHSIQAFLIKYRMNRACELLHHVHLSIGDIARSVGYEDPLLFSKLFKKMTGHSPSAYRKQTSSFSTEESS